LTVREAGDGVVGHGVRDLLRRLRAVGTEPVRRPVERAEKRPRRDGGVRGAELTTADAVGHQRADAALVAVALRDDARAQARREGVDLEVRRGAVDLVEQAQHVGRREDAKPAWKRRSIAPRPRQCREHPLERLVLAEEQQFVLAAEVVIEVSRREVGR